MVNDLIMAHSAKTVFCVSSLDGVGNLTTLKGWDAVVTDNVGWPTSKELNTENSRMLLTMYLIE